MKHLSKGLNSTLSPKLNVPEMKRDIRDFPRKLGEIREFSADINDSTKNSQESRDSLVRSKGEFNPPRNKNKVVDAVVDFLLKQKFEETNQINKCNISKEEGKGLLKLSNNKDKVINSYYLLINS